MHPALVRKVLYPAYRALRRDRVLAYLEEMRRIQIAPPEEIRRFRWEKLRTLLDYAGRHVPYYRDLFKRMGIAAEAIRTETDFAELPLLRKHDILGDPEAFISEAYPRGRLSPDSTGGSTGENLYFNVGREAREAASANAIRMNEWIGIEIGDRIAYLWGTPIDVEKSRRLATALKIWLSNQMILSAYRMDESSVAQYVRRLRRFKPHMLASYPSALAHFARAVQDAGMAVPRPKALLLSGETLYNWQRDIVQEVFGSHAYDHYGCREFGPVARECKAGKGLHIACERVFVEVIPSDLADDSGAAGEIVITDLDNRGMPFIRYAIEDFGSITWEKCTCGLSLPRLTSTIGRTFDVVRAPNGNALGGTFWTILLRQRKGIERFQVIQDGLDEITIAIRPTADFTDDTRNFILAKVREACGPGMRVRFELKPDLETTPAGKHRFVISRLKAPAEGGGATPEV
jgi:phenylacetate-CoA ligase